MTHNQIKRFFKRYRYPVSVRVNKENKVVQVYNCFFTILIDHEVLCSQLKADCHWYDTKLPLTDENIHDTIINCWKLTSGHLTIV